MILGYANGIIGSGACVHLAPSGNQLSDRLPRH